MGLALHFSDSRPSNMPRTDQMGKPLSRGCWRLLVFLASREANQAPTAAVVQLRLPLEPGQPPLQVPDHPLAFWHYVRPSNSILRSERNGLRFARIGLWFTDLFL